MDYYSATKKEWNSDLRSNVDGPRGLSYRVKPEGEKSYDTSYMWDLKTNDTNELIYKTETESQT